MYLIPIHVPIYQGGDRRLVTTEWKRSLELLRDSLQGRFGTLVVFAPSLPLEGAGAEQLLEEVVEDQDGIRLVPSFDLRCRTRAYSGSASNDVALSNGRTTPRRGRRSWLPERRLQTVRFHCLSRCQPGGKTNPFRAGHRHRPANATAFPIKGHQGEAPGICVRDIL